LVDAFIYQHQYEREEKKGRATAKKVFIREKREKSGHIAMVLSVS
jgi:hypothetical protein